MWTRKAATYAIGAALLLGAGFAFQRTAAMVLGIVLTSHLIVQRFHARPASVRATATVQPDRLVEGDDFTVDVEMQALGRRPRTVEARLGLDPALDVLEGSDHAFIRLQRGRAARLRARIQAPVRGAYDPGAVRIHAGDPFGLFQSRTRAEAAAPVLVLPRAEDLRGVETRALYPRPTFGAFPVRQQGMGADFYALREYRPDDEMRMVNWKASARRGSLIVTEHEHESNAEVTLFLDARAQTAVGTVGSNALLWGVRATATLARALVRSRNAVRLVVYGDAAPTHLPPGTGERHLHRIWEELASVRPAGSLPFGDAVDRFLPHLKPKSPVVVITPLVQDPSLEHSIGRLLAQRSHVTVVATSVAACMRAADPKADAETDLEKASHARLQTLRALGASGLVWDPQESLAAALDRMEASP